MPLTKPPVLPPWADAGDKVQPTDQEIQTGWPLSSVPPSRQRFNWLQNFLANGIRYLTRRGVPDYAADETYEIGDRIIGDDGKTYRSLQAANVGNTPSASPLFWERWGFASSELSAEFNKTDYKASARVATTANLAALSGLLTVDGVVLVAGDRALVKDQATLSQNGIYVAAAGAWARAVDADDGTKLTPGALVSVEEGTANADSQWMLTTNGAITIGVTAITFARNGPDTSNFVAKTGAQTMEGPLALTAGQLQTIDGTAAAPGLRVGTSSATGLFSAADQSLRATTAGLERFRIDSSGNLSAVVAGATKEIWHNGIVTQSLGANGYMIFPVDPVTGRRLRKVWGKFTGTISTPQTVTLPIAFPNNNYGVNITRTRHAAGDGLILGIAETSIGNGVPNITLSQFTTKFDSSSASGAGNPFTAFYEATGD